jgi:hypothetical protein
MMSLTVSPETTAHAQAGTLTSDAFYQGVKASLPFAVDVIHQLVHHADASEEDMAEFAPQSLSDHERGQLLRATASTAIRNALEEWFSGHQHRALGIRIAFKNCHNVAVFLDTEVGHEHFRQWTSAREQVLAQSPQLVDC